MMLQPVSQVALDAVRVSPKLYIGSAPAVGTPLGALGFRVLVLAAQEYQHGRQAFPGVSVVHAGFVDRDPAAPTDIAVASEAAALVAVEVAESRRTLVTCWQGRNRSGLVVAFALVKLYGVSGRRAMRMVRAVRPTALTNDAYARLLRSL